jgi:DNA-directed RNA polymerase specialized sigma24 family protein
MVKALKNADKYDSEKLNLDAWLQVVLRTVGVDAIRSRMRGAGKANSIANSLDRPLLDLMNCDADNATYKDYVLCDRNYQQAVEDALYVSQVVNAIESDRGRDIAHCVIEGMNWPEIGRRYSTSRSTVHRWMQREVRPSVVAALADCERSGFTNQPRWKKVRMLARSIPV